MAETGKSLSILYEEPDERPTIPVSGAIGAPSPDGSLIIAHLYSEFATIPAREDHDIGEDGRVDLSKGHRITRGDVTRKVMATIVMSPKTAASLGQWLAGQVAMVQQPQQRKKDAS